MGWFAIAFIAAFVAFWQWRKWPDWSPEKRYDCGALLGIIIVVLTGIAIWYACQHSPALLLDRIGQGYVGRILLGAVLGIATAYVVERRSEIHRLELKILEAAVHQRRAAGVSGKDSDHAATEGIGGMSVTGLLWIAVVVVLFAIASPHLDGWLRRVTSLKTPLGEFQVASNAVRSSLKTASIDWLSDISSMEALSGYGPRIRQDAEHLTNFEIPELEEQKSSNPSSVSAIQQVINEKRKLANDTLELYFVFEHLISPIARCVSKAISNGYAIDSVRLNIRPMAEALQHIIYIDGKPVSDKEYRASHDKFWGELRKLPGRVAPFLVGNERDKCLAIDADYPNDENMVGWAAFPEIRNYRHLPYLYVASLLFAAFMRDEEIAFKIIESKSKLETGDYPLLYYSGTLSSIHGRGLEVAFELLETMRRIAQERGDKLRRRLDDCTKQNCDRGRVDLLHSQLKRHRAAERLATNDLAYAVANDLTEGGKAGESYRAKLSDLLEDLRQMTKPRDKNKVRDEDKIDDVEKNAYVETYAYVTIVLEARKKDPSIDKIKEMIDDIEKVVEKLDKAVARNVLADKRTLYALKLARAHLTSARELAGQ